MTDDKDPLAGTQAAAADDPDALRADIARTREDLADTVEALAAKADLKGRARGKAAELRTEARRKVAQAGHAAKGKAEPARQQVLDKTAAARAKAQETLLPQASHATAGAVSAVRQRPVAALTAVGAAVGVLALVRRLRTRRSRRRRAGFPALLQRRSRRPRRLHL